MSNLALATSTIFLSFILGAVLLVFVGIMLPDVFAVILNGANWLENALGNTGLANRYNNWIRFLVGDEQLTLVFFTIVARIIISMGAAGVQSMSRR